MKAKDLRNSILQLAVQGKLVPQDPNDEPASVLLERIRAERVKLIKEKKIKAPKGGESVIYRASDGSHYEKRGKGEPVCIDDEIPFDIPESWAWVRLESIIADTSAGKSPQCKDRPRNHDEWGVIKTTAIQDGFFLEDENKVLPKGFSVQESQIISQGDLLITRAGPRNRTGILCVVEQQVERLILSDKTVRLAYLGDYVNPQYLMHAISSPLIQQLVIGSMSGMAASQVNISQAKMKGWFIPLPPLTEQSRICTVFDKLAPLMAEYGTLEEARERLDTELPDRLRKSILQIAVQGKLVSQNQNDEPASVLLERIRTERAALVKAGKLKAPKGGESVIYRASDGGYYEKRGKGEPVCIDDEIPFEIPESWEWVRLSNVASIAGGGTPDKGILSYWNGGIPWASVKDLKGDTLKSTIDTISSEGLASKPSISACSNGDLIVATRLVPGKSIICAIDCTINQDLKRIRTSLNIEYLHIWFQSERMAFHKLGQGTTVPGIKLGDLEEALIPIPPLAEQQRICSAYNDVSKRVTNQ